jgi:hypothetical protein
MAAQKQHQQRLKREGLPGGIFSIQTFQFWYTFEGLGMQYFGIVYDHLAFQGHVVYLVAFWHMLWSVW